MSDVAPKKASSPATKQAESSPAKSAETSPAKSTEKPAEKPTEKATEAKTEAASSTPETSEAPKKYETATAKGEGQKAVSPAYRSNWADIFSSKKEPEETKVEVSVEPVADKINFADKFSKFSDHWSPHVIVEMNDYQFKLVRISGEFTWHDHQDTDETFIVIEGSMRIEFRDRTVELSEGEMFVVPRGVEHKPVSDKECKIMVIEPRGVVNTGNAGGNQTAANDVWI